MSFVDKLIQRNIYGIDAHSSEKSSKNYQAPIVNSTQEIDFLYIYYTLMSFLAWQTNHS